MEASTATTAERISVRRRVGVAVGVLAAAVLLVLGLLPSFTSPYIVSLFFLLYMFITLSAGWNMFSGYTGYINFGYTAFLGVGAYGMAVLITRYHFPWIVAIPTASGLAAAFALIVGLPLLRIRGVYFAIAMLSLATVVGILASTRFLAPVTKGGVGIPMLSGMSLTMQYYVMGLIALATVLATYAIANSRFGLRLLSVREDELAAQVMGIHTGTVKLAAFALSALFGGAAGAVQAAFLSYIEPASVFNINYTVRPIVMALFGGQGTVFGPVLGAVVFTFVAEIIWSRFLALHLAIFGALLILLVLGMPQGVIPWLQRRSFLPKTRKL
ncbi:MAG: branched-chain amino acid ABC transporter permease [Chloroflexi bacterium]|nr:branched-chain amino acid ABC transporter permease [Chloroflexota bacterium]